MEASGLGGPVLGLVLVPGLLAAGVGTLIFVGLDSLTGFGTFSLSIPGLPPFAHPTGPCSGGPSCSAWSPPSWAPASACWALAFSPHVTKHRMVLTPVFGLAVAGLAIAFAEGTGRSSNVVLFSGQSALPDLVLHAAGWTVGALVLLVVCKGVAYGISLSGFRGGPVFPAMFIGAAAGVAASHLPGMSLVPGVAMGIGAMTTVMLKLPLTSTLLATLLLASDGINVVPLVIVAVVVAYVATAWLPQTPAELKAIWTKRSGQGTAAANETVAAPAAARAVSRGLPHRPMTTGTSSTGWRPSDDRPPDRLGRLRHGCGHGRADLRPGDGGPAPQRVHPDRPGGVRGGRPAAGPPVAEPGSGRDNLRALYAPIALVSLPLVWMLAVTFGFSFIFWGIDTGIRPAVLRNQRIIPVHAGLRRARGCRRIWLTFVEATIGLGLVALLISYLPTIYAAHHEREKGISVLRPFAGTPPSPVEHLASLHRLGALDNPDMWRTATNWMLDLDQTHCAFPALCYFPESRPEQSWVASIGSVLDGAALLLSASDFSHRRRDPAEEIKGPMMALAYGMPTVVRIGHRRRLAHRPAGQTARSDGIGHRSAPPVDLHPARAEYIDGPRSAAPPARRSRRPAGSHAGGGSPGSAPATTRPLRGLAGLTLAMPAPWTTDRPAPRRPAAALLLAPSDRGRTGQCPDRRPTDEAGDAADPAGRTYRWLNPPDSSLVIATVTGCLAKWSMAALMSSRSSEGEIAADPLAHQDPLHGDVGHRAGQGIGRYLPTPAPAAGRRCRRGCTRGPRPPGSARPPRGSRSGDRRRTAARRGRA